LKLTEPFLKPYFDNIFNIIKRPKKTIKLFILAPFVCKMPKGLKSGTYKSQKIPCQL